MAKLQLTFASALYDRMQPIYTGEVPVDGIDLNFIRIEQPRPIFDRMSGGQEFDVAEYSSSEYVQRYANKQCPFVAIPVFPSRCFRHSFIGINKKSGISKPKDLEGKRIGVALYTMTAAIFIRGILQHDHGVDFSNCTWVQGAIIERFVRRPLLQFDRLEQRQHGGRAVRALLVDCALDPGAVREIHTMIVLQYPANEDRGRHRVERDPDALAFEVLGLLDARFLVDPDETMTEAARGKNRDGNERALVVGISLHVFGARIFRNIELLSA